MWPFKRKTDRSEVGMERGLDLSGRAYRKERIADIAALTGKTRAEAQDFADRWLIHEVTMTVGDGDPKNVWIPSPIWDDEWMLHRDHFDSWDDAYAHVLTAGGVLLAMTDDH